MAITATHFGTTRDGLDVTAFTLECGSVKARIMNYGATVLSIECPDRDGNVADVVCGFDTLSEYQSDINPYFGACCGRYANRIAQGQFTLDGKDYTLAVNNAPNALHGGLVGFDKKVWDAEIIGDAVKMTLVSPDGDEGYPGTLTVSVTYTLSAEGEFRLDYEATTDRKTVLNLTNHSYFNLGGHNSGSVHDQLICIHADRYTEVDEHSTPTGNLLPVEGTEMDLTKPTPIGKRIAEVQGRGYDHNYCINQAESGALTLAAVASDPQSGRRMECWTTEPGVQFYAANYVENVTGKGGAVYNIQESFCLETQHWPDSPNQPEFPTTELAPGEVYTQTSIYKFGLE
ncbi:aldose epimerase family protein [Pontiella agarivorans]|uniref:Aldose 1-epimerase n=1 Tax=Pontiella agarivorans TaxID=3038953 RepID=A0ABU5MWY9_9BACT|nr:aldose epimerase family protein [Pontiella agarivorans]MDZ8118713.1 galactose mutarotase [Pontiella agarivorans]